MPGGARRRVGGAHAQAQGAPEVAAAGGAVGLHDDEGRVGVAGELEEPERDGTGEGGGPVEHDQGEGPAAQQDVGAPSAAGGVGGTHDPEPRRASGGSHGRAGEPGPVGGGEGAPGIDDGDPGAGGERRLDETADEGGRAAAGSAEELGQAPARHPAGRPERRVEGAEAEGEAAGRRALHHHVGDASTQGGEQVGRGGGGGGQEGERANGEQIPKTTDVPAGCRVRLGVAYLPNTNRKCKVRSAGARIGETDGGHREGAGDCSRPRAGLS